MYCRQPNKKADRYDDPFTHSDEQYIMGLRCTHLIRYPSGGSHFVV